LWLAAPADTSDPLAKSNLVVRVLTSALLLPLLLALLFLGPAWGWYLLVLAACVVAGSELFAMTHPGDRVAQGIGVATTAAVSVCLYLFSRDPRVVLSVLIATTLIGVLTPLWRLGEIESAALRLVAGVAGPLYIGVLLTCIALLRHEQGALGAPFVLLALGFAWLGDTGGYFVGRQFGKHRLYPAVSPKKTWEGLFGSLVGAEAGALVIRSAWLPAMPLDHALILAAVAGGLGQLGDLAESVLKRSAGVKDSGSIIPGHGGLLDRIDALLFVAPVVYLYSLWGPLARALP
jgi:phosphatidate cytidylyltransferase